MYEVYLITFSFLILQFHTACEKSFKNKFSVKNDFLATETFHAQNKKNVIFLNVSKVIHPQHGGKCKFIDTEKLFNKNSIGFYQQWKNFLKIGIK